MAVAERKTPFVDKLGKQAVHVEALDTSLHGLGGGTFDAISFSKTVLFVKNEILDSRSPAGIDLDREPQEALVKESA